ncbi:uncharacterized protein LOC108038016 [Drosophila rhopaloa]|uniref:Uncharacterized protein LOC108038016 n=1 Tax=Drosophila rhopaloa TaxID=1041015 RepID=A0A6P4E1D0_DRORH|nr:uncharacterized protein LOC108038016 [Drosophila rhopaloa]
MGFLDQSKQTGIQLTDSVCRSDTSLYQHSPVISDHPLLGFVQNLKMSRLQMLCGFTRSVLRSTRTQRYMLRCLSDNSDTTFITLPTDQAQSAQKDVEKAKRLEHTSHLFVWPDLNDKNMHHVEECKGDRDDDITASWGWKNNELDVEQLAGMPSPSEVEDPYMQLEQEAEDHQPYFSEEEHSGIQEELQFERTRSLREQLSNEINSQEPFTSFERSSLISVRENVDFMMQELSQISLLLNTLYTEQSSSFNNSMGEDQKCLEAVYSGPEMAAMAFNQPKINENLEHEGSDQVNQLNMNEDLDQKGGSDQINQPNMNENLDQKEESDQPIGFELTNGVAYQPEPDVIESSVITNKSENIKSSVIPNESENIESSMIPNELKDIESSVITNESEDIESSLVTNVSEDIESSLVTNESEDIESSLVTNESMDIESSLFATEPEDVETSEQITTELAQETGESDTKESSPSKNTEGTPKTDDRPDIQPRDPIHTYRPFKTIEVPSKKTSSNLYSDLNEDQAFNQESLAVTGLMDNPGYTVSAQLTEPESRFLMRMALKQALNDLETGKNKYKATILESETE